MTDHPFPPRLSDEDLVALAHEVAAIMSVVRLVPVERRVLAMALAWRRVEAGDVGQELVARDGPELCAGYLDGSDG